MAILTLEMHVPGRVRIEDAVEDAVRVAGALDVNVRLKVSDREVFVQPGDQASTLVGLYGSALRSGSKFVSANVTG
jgi:hypothetical protein